MPGKLRPARANQHPGSDIFLQGRLAGLAAVAAPMQALARQIDGERHLSAVRMRVYADAGTLEFDVRPQPLRFAQAVHDRVFQLERTKVSMRDRGMAPAEVAGESRSRADVGSPVDVARRGIELIRVSGLEARQLQEHAVADARPQAGAVGRCKRSCEGDACRAFARLLGAEVLELAGQKVGQATRRAGNELQGVRGHRSGTG